MKITELLTKETVLLSIKGNGKHTVINELVDLLDEQENYLTENNLKQLY